jgi:hypothetical protein
MTKTEKRKHALIDLIEKRNFDEAFQKCEDLFSKEDKSVDKVHFRLAANILSTVLKITGEDSKKTFKVFQFKLIFKYFNFKISTN